MTPPPLDVVGREGVPLPPWKESRIPTLWTDPVLRAEEEGVDDVVEVVLPVESLPVLRAVHPPTLRLVRREEYVVDCGPCVESPFVSEAGGRGRGQAGTGRGE